MSQFHLHLRIGRLRPLGENLQDQAGPVDDIGTLDDLLDVALLRPREFVIENDVLNLVLNAVFLDFLKFSRADVSGLVGAVHPLHEHLVAKGSGGLRQELQLVKILLHLALSSFLQDDADEYGFLGLVLAHTFITLQTWKYVL